MRALALFLLIVSLGAVSADSVAATTAADYARLPSFENPEIAPGGSYFAARVNSNNQYLTAVFNIADGEFSPIQTFTESATESVRWFRWITPERLLISVAFLSIRGRNVQTTETRLLVFDANSLELTSPFRDRRNEVPIQVQDDIVSFLPDDPDYILIQYSRDTPVNPDVYKVDITKTAKHKRIKSGRASVNEWMADRDGEIRLGQGLKGEREPYLTVRLAGEKDWLDYSHRLASDAEEFTPLSFTAEPNKMYVFSTEGGDTNGLYIFDLENDEFEELIYRHPTVDLSSINVDPNTGTLRSINFVENELATIYFERRPIADSVEELMRQFPDKEASVASVTKDGRHAIVLVDGPADAGAYFLIDRVENRVRQLPSQYPGLEGEPFGVSWSVSYEARDGLEIPAYVTLPPGTDEFETVAGLPFVILPHGGPAARDFLRFDFIVQFLASRGFGVLQMNFRGSSGYGQSFQGAGEKEWGQAMQNDITDGVHWLIDNGRADPDRIAIVGASYGGYAALMGAVKTPDLFQCAISFAGVTDLPDLIQDASRYYGGRYATRFIGDSWKDRKALAENSPARRAAEINIPVLLLHGDKDIVVDVDQSRKMAKALEKNDKPYEYIQFENGDHHLSLYAHRLEFLSQSEELLSNCLN